MTLRNGDAPTCRAFPQIHRKAPKAPCSLQEGIRPAARVRCFCRNKRREERLLWRHPFLTANHRSPREFCRFQTKCLNRPF